MISASSDTSWSERNLPRDANSAAEEPLIDLDDGDEVLDFAYSYLKTHSRPPSNDEVRSVTAAIALYKGSANVPAATLERFVTGLLT